MISKTLTVIGALCGGFFAYAAARGGVDVAIQDGRDLLVVEAPTILSIAPSNEAGRLRAIVRNPSNREAVILAVEGRQHEWLNDADALAVENAVANVSDNSSQGSLEMLDSQTVDAKPQMLCSDSWTAKLDHVVNLRGRSTGRLVIPVKGDLSCDYEVRLITTHGTTDWASVEI